MSNLCLFQWPAPSDHPAHPTRSSQSRRDFKDLPTLPSGYPGMFFIALIPSWFRSAMDSRVVDWAQGARRLFQNEAGQEGLYERKYG